MTGKGTGIVMKKENSGCLFLLAGIFLAVFLKCSVTVSVCAAEPQDAENPQCVVMFVLDASSSMKTSDPDRLAPDGIAQLVYTLPTGSRAGFVAFNTGIPAEQIPVSGKEREAVPEAAEEVEYTGYSDAGAGLSRAVEILAGQDAAERQIVLLSDGEILMDSDEATAESRRSYREAAGEAAEEGIRIHVISLGTGTEDEESSVSAAAELTGGRVCAAPQAADIQEALDSILTEEIGVKQSTVALVDAGGGIETVHAQLPYTYADKVRVLLTGTAPVENLSANFQAQSAEQISGERYSLIELNRLHGQDTENGRKLEISFSGTKGSRVRVNVIPEYCAVPVVEVVYKDERPAEPDTAKSAALPLDKNGQELPGVYRRTAEITFSFLDPENQKTLLWEEEFFENGRIKVTVDGEETALSLHGGRIVLERPVYRTEEILAELDYSGLPVNVRGDREVRIRLEGPPELPVEDEEEPSYMRAVFLAAGLGMLAAAAAGAAVCYMRVLRRREEKRADAEAGNRPKEGTCGAEKDSFRFAGRLNLYITQAQSGDDYPPLSYSLLRLPEGGMISLGEILERCGVTERFPGAEAVFFQPGNDRSLIVTNNSDSTVMKNREILMKNRQCALLFDGKMDITFEDEVSELMFQYKE